MAKRIMVFLLSCFLLVQGSIAFAATMTLRFATGYFYPPFVYSSMGGHPYGFDIALVNAVCAQLGVECTFSQMPLTELFNNLEAGKLDAIVGAISITADRRAKVEFTNPYFKSTMSYLGKSKESYAVTPQNLKGKEIGVIKSSTFETYLEMTYGNNVKIKPYSSLEEAVMDLSNGDIDLLLMDTPVAEYWQTHSSGELKIMDKPLEDNVPSDEGFGIAVQKGNYPLVIAMNKALATIYANGTYDNLIDMYFAD